jgi:hypothetical protein
MICANPKCLKEIQVTASYRILAFDRPYINLYFHVDCVVDEEESFEIIRNLSKNEGKSNKRNWVHRK